MNKTEKLILMYKDFEILSFKADLTNSRFELVEKLDRFDLAPQGMKEEKADINLELSKFFNTRTISVNRWDYDLIIKNTNTSSSLELSFKGHGLSLFNHYWFKKEGEDLKYDDINFFANKWDDSFARAVLNGDYDSLSKCDLNVPDIVTAGFSVKGWVYEDGPKLYKLGIDKGHYEEPLAEVLASRLAQRILNEGEVLKYDLVKLGDKYASRCPCMLTIDEELIPLSKVLPRELYNLFSQANMNKENLRLFYKKLRENYPIEYYHLFVKLAVIRSLCFVTDLHFGNISVIKNIKTGEIRPAPLYDLAGSFGSSRTGKSFISKVDKSTYFIIYYIFGTFDPELDYSWYIPSKLDGFDVEIREILSKSSFYTPELIDRVIDVYLFQKESLDEVVKKV